MTFSFLIKSLDSFLLGKIDRKSLLEQLEEMENALLHMEKESFFDSKIIEQSMEVIDNLFTIINDYTEDLEAEIERDISKLEEIELFLRNKKAPSSEVLSENTLLKEKKIVPIFSPVHRILEEAKKYSFSKMNSIEFSIILENSFNDICNMKEENFNFKDEKDREEFNFVLEEILELIKKTGISIKEDKKEEDFYRHIRELYCLNENFMKLYGKITFSLDKTDSVNELIGIILEYTKNEDFITENYLFFEESLFEYLEDEIDEGDIRNILKKMKQSVTKTKKEYEKTCLSSDEWTVEVAAGDRLLMEGLNEYEEGLNFLEKHLTGKDEKIFNTGLVKIYEANKKLLLNQYLTEYIKKIISRISVSCFFRKSF